MVASTTAAGTISQIARGFASFSASSASEAAPVAFFLTNSSTAFGDLSNSTQLCPFLMSRRTILAPIRPRPIMPSCISISSVFRLLRGNDFLAGFENLNKRMISTSDVSDCGTPRYRLRAPVNQRIPEARTAHGEANEAGNCSCSSEPLTDFAIVLAPTENDAADSVPASAAGGNNNPFAVFLTVEPFDLPHVRLNPRILKFLNSLSHQPGTNL